MLIIAAVDWSFLARKGAYRSMPFAGAGLVLDPVRDNADAESGIYGEVNFASAFDEEMVLASLLMISLVRNQRHAILPRCGKRGTV